MRKETKETTSSGFKTRRILLIILCSVLSLVLIVLVAAAIWLQSTLNLIGREVDNSQMSQSEYQEFLENESETKDPNFNGEEMSAEEALKHDLAEIIQPHDDVINIMLIGQDRREGQGRQRSDAMILCTINYTKNTVSLTSFMRDMYVKIPGYGGNRINACYQIGGMELLNKCLKDNFGVLVDGNIEVDFGGFMSVVNYLGGVDIELTKAEADYLNRNGNWDVNSSSAGTWSLVEGMNHLTGEQALAYSRIRYIGNADFGRTERQRNVLTAIFEATSDMGILELNSLLRELLPMMATDMSDSQLVSYAFDAFQIMGNLKIENYRIPADNAYRDAVVDNMQVLVPNMEACRQLLRDIIS